MAIGMAQITGFRAVTDINQCVFKKHVLHIVLSFLWPYAYNNIAIYRGSMAYQVNMALLIWLNSIVKSS